MALQYPEQLRVVRSLVPSDRAISCYFCVADNDESFAVADQTLGESVAAALLLNEFIQF